METYPAPAAQPESARLTVAEIDAKARQGDGHAQMSRGKLMMAFYGTSSAMAFVYTGAITADAYGTLQAAIGIILTIAVYGLINAVLVRYAINNQTTVAEFSRTILGRAGSAIATIIFALVAIYYAIFEGAIVESAFQKAFGGPGWMWALIIVLYSSPLVIGGVRHFLDKLNGVMLPIYFFGLVAAVIWAGVEYGFTGNWISHQATNPITFTAGGPGWLATFSAYMGIWIMMMFGFDYASNGKRKDIKFHQHVSFGWIFYILAYGCAAFFGIFLSYSIPGVEVTEAGVAAGLVGMMGLLGLLVVFTSQTRINTANYYLGSTNLKAFFERVFRFRLPYGVWVGITGVIIFLLMLLPVVKYLLVALAWQGVLVTGWVAIATTHIVLGQGKNYEHADIPDDYYKGINGSGLTAWLIATVVGLIILETGTWDKGFATYASTWGPIVTAVLAAVVYAVLWRTRPERHTALKA